MIIRLGHLHSLEWGDSKSVDCLIGIKLLSSDQKYVLTCHAIESNSIAHHHEHFEKTKLSHPPERSDGLLSPSLPHKRPSRSTPGPLPSASSSAGARNTHDSLLSIDELLASLRPANELMFHLSLHVHVHNRGCDPCFRYVQHIVTMYGAVGLGPFQELQRRSWHAEFDSDFEHEYSLGKKQGQNKHCAKCEHNLEMLDRQVDNLKEQITSLEKENKSLREQLDRATIASGPSPMVTDTTSLASMPIAKVTDLASRIQLDVTILPRQKPSAKGKERAHEPP